MARIARYLNWQPYLRGMTTGMQFGHGIDGAYVDCIAGGLRYVPKVFQPQEPIVGELLDVYEDVILIGELASDKPRPTQRVSRGPEDGGDWFSWTGFGSQMGHEYHLSRSSDRYLDFMFTPRGYAHKYTLARKPS